MRIYNYDPITKEFINSSEADENPLEPGKYLIPFSSTIIAPPEQKEGYVLVFDDIWKYSAIVGESISEVPIVTDDMIDAERNKRIKAGKNFKVNGIDIRVTGSDRDMLFLNALKIKALELINENVKGVLLTYRDGMNINHSLTPEDLVKLINKALDWVTACFEVSWDMKDEKGAFTEGKPSDYTDDKYWPSFEEPKESETP